MNLALGLALLVGGGILIYMGWKGETLQHTLQDINKKRKLTPVTMTAKQKKTVSDMQDIYAGPNPPAKPVPSH